MDSRIANVRYRQRNAYHPRAVRQWSAGGGTVSGSVAVALSGAGNTVGPIAVNLRTIPSAAEAAPTGVFDTPIDGTTGVTGSIAVTGWALDDVEVTRVRILRDPGL